MTHIPYIFEVEVAGAWICESEQMQRRVEAQCQATLDAVTLCLRASRFWYQDAWVNLFEIDGAEEYQDQMIELVCGGINCEFDRAGWLVRGTLQIGLVQFDIDMEQENQLLLCVYNPELTAKRIRFPECMGSRVIHKLAMPVHLMNHRILISPPPAPVELPKQPLLVLPPVPKAKVTV